MFSCSHESSIQLNNWNSDYLTKEVCFVFAFCAFRTEKGPLEILWQHLTLSLNFQEVNDTLLPYYFRFLAPALPVSP